MSRPLPNVIPEEEEDDDSTRSPSSSIHGRCSSGRNSIYGIRNTEFSRSHSPSVISTTSRYFPQCRIDDQTMNNMICLSELSQKQSHFGTTYKYINKQTMVEYAVTIWKTGLSDEELSDVCHELEQLRNLRHKRIASFYAYHLKDGVLTMFRAFEPWGTVADRLKKGSLPEEVAQKYFRNVMEALQYLHERPEGAIVHGNLKVVNLLVTLSDEVQVADIQIHNCPTNRASDRRRLLYSAPELLKDNESPNSTTPATDIWAAGCALVAMLTRFPPFKAKFLTESIDEVRKCLLQIHRSKSKEKYTSSYLVPNASIHVAKIVDQTFIEDPTERPTASEILERFYDCGPVALKRPSIPSVTFSTAGVRRRSSFGLPSAKNDRQQDPYYYDPHSSPLTQQRKQSTAGVTITVTNEKDETSDKKGFDSSYYYDEPTPQFEKQERPVELEFEEEESEVPEPSCYCCRWYLNRIAAFSYFLLKWVGMVFLAAVALASVVGSVVFAIFLIYNGIGVICQCQLNEGFIVLIALILLPIIILLTTLCCNNSCEKYKVAVENGKLERSSYVTKHPNDDIVLCGYIVVQGRKTDEDQPKRKTGNADDDPTAPSHLPRTAFVRHVAQLA